MALAKVLNGVFTRRKQREVAIVASFGELVLRVANDEPIGDEEVDRVLDEAGKTPDDLRKAVELLQQRQRWAAMQSDTTALAHEITANERDIEQEKERMEATIKAGKQNVSELQDRNTALQAQIDGIRRARQQLHETRPERIRQREQELTVEIQRRRNQIEICSNLKRTTSLGAPTAERVQELDREIAALQGEIRQHQAELDRLADEALKP